MVTPASAAHESSENLNDLYVTYTGSKAQLSVLLQEPHLQLLKMHNTILF